MTRPLPSEERTAALLALDLNETGFCSGSDLAGELCGQTWLYRPLLGASVNAPPPALLSAKMVGEIGDWGAIHVIPAD